MKLGRPEKAAVIGLVLLLHSVPLYPQRIEQRQEKEPAHVSLLMEPELLDKPDLERKSALSNCTDTYDGIGVKIAFGSNRITEVAKGWPAHRAGIRPGDVIEHLTEPRIIDGYMAITISRNGKKTNMKLRTERICMRDKPW